VRGRQSEGELSAAFAELFRLYGVFADNCRTQAGTEIRVYTWQPTSPPELPCIYTWIEDGTYEIVDTARGDDTLVVVSTIGVEPSDLPDNMDELTRLVDIFRATVDPALDEQGPLGRTVREAKRLSIRSAIPDYGENNPMVALEVLIQLKLAALIR
jgi:hypothetical protein